MILATRGLAPLLALAPFAPTLHPGAGPRRRFERPRQEDHPASLVFKSTILCI